MINKELYLLFIGPPPWRKGIVIGFCTKVRRFDSDPAKEVDFHR